MTCIVAKDHRWLLAGLVSATLLATAAMAGAQTTLTGLKRARFRSSAVSESADRATIRFADDAALLNPLDPTCAAQVASSLQLASSNQSGTPIALPCTGWSGSGHRFRYRDTSGAAGGVHRIAYASGRLTITLKGANYAEIVGPVSYVDVTFRVGSTSYCGRMNRFIHNDADSIVILGPAGSCNPPSPTPTNGAPAATSTPTFPAATTSTPTSTSPPAPVCGDGVVQAPEQCDDGNTANGDCCSATCQVAGAGSACTNDGNPCTDDQCDALGSCQHLPNTQPCDDGSSCTQSDTCSAGACQGSAIKPWINEVNYDGYDPIFVTRDHEEFVEIAGPAGLDLSGYKLLAVEGAGSGSFFQPCQSGSLDAGQAYFVATIPSGTVIGDDTGKGTGFVVACFANTSDAIESDGDCDVVLSPMPSTSSNLKEGALSNLYDCADGVLLLDGANGFVDAVSYEGHVSLAPPYGGYFAGAPDIGRDWGLPTDNRRSLVKTTDNLQRETDESKWAETANNGDSPGQRNGLQALSCYDEPGYTNTRYPIVLMHGLYGFDSLFGVVDYWNGIVEALQDGGATVYVATVSQLNSPQARGEQVIPQIEQLLQQTGASKVNLIGHSQGAIDARYVAGVRPDLAASVTSIGGPNKGAELADFLRDNFQDGSFSEAVAVALGNSLGDILALLSGSTNPNDAIPAVTALTTQSMAQFNATYPAGVPPTACGEGAAIANGIRYFSWSGTAIQTNPLDDSDSLFAVTSLFYSEANDGLVGRCSSHLGDVIRDDYFFNHIDEVNLLFGLVSPFEVNPRTVFRTHANRLKNLGL